jgi:hypothetical protein
MLRRSLIIAGLALSTLASASGPSNAQRANAPHSTVVHHVWTYDSPSSPHYYAQYYGPSYAPDPVTAAASLPGAAVCLAFSLIGAC